MKTIGPLRVLALFLLIAPLASGELQSESIQEGVNILSRTVMNNIIVENYIGGKKFYDASPLLAATLLSTEVYPAPREDYRLKIETPVEKLERDVYDIAAEQVQEKFFDRKIIVLARGDLSADSMAGVAYAKSQNAPILLTRSDDMPEATLSAIQNLAPQKIIILGGERAISKDLEESLKRIQTPKPMISPEDWPVIDVDVSRIWGPTRYETAVEIAKKMEFTEVIVVTDGENPSVEAAIIAAEYRAPLLYVTSTRVPDAVGEFLSENKLNYLGRPMRIMLVDVDTTVGEEIRNITLTRELGAELEVVITNRDDHDVWVDLLVDRITLTKEVKSGLTHSFGVFDLDVGEHDLKIRWLDPSTDEFYEKTTKVTLDIQEKARKEMFVDLHTLSERK